LSYIFQGGLQPSSPSRRAAPGGHDDIPVRTLKLSKYLLAPLLSNVINESICDSVVPNNLKIAKVVPFFKTGDSEIPTNYRPISVLTYFKIFIKKY